MQWTVKYLYKSFIWASLLGSFEQPHYQRARLGCCTFTFIAYFSKDSIHWFSASISLDFKGRKRLLFQTWLTSNQLNETFNHKTRNFSADSSSPAKEESCKWNKAHSLWLNWRNSSKYHLCSFLFVVQTDFGKQRLIIFWIMNFDHLIIWFSNHKNRY